MLMVIITVAMNTDIIQLIYVTAVICLNYNSKCHLVSLLMLCPLPLLLGQNSAYPNNGGSRFTHTIPVRINQTICFTLQKPKISVFWTDCRCKVKMSGNAKMQPARSFVLFVCCSFSDPVIMHTAIQHWQQINVNMGNDRMITNKLKPTFSLDTNLPQHPPVHKRYVMVRVPMGQVFL